MNSLVAATHTPFHADGSLNLTVVEKHAAHLLENHVTLTGVKFTNPDLMACLQCLEAEVGRWDVCPGALTNGCWAPWLPGRAEPWVAVTTLPPRSSTTWWPHNEAILATLLAWKLTGEERFAERHRLVHDWSFALFPDPEHGEWFGYLHHDDSVSSRVKGTMRKGTFHLPRML